MNVSGQLLGTQRGAVGGADAGTEWSGCTLFSAVTSRDIIHSVGFCHSEFFQLSGDIPATSVYDSNGCLISVLTLNDIVHQTQSAVRRCAEARGARASPACRPAGVAGPGAGGHPVGCAFLPNRRAWPAEPPDLWDDPRR